MANPTPVKNRPASTRATAAAAAGIAMTGAPAIDIGITGGDRKKSPKACRSRRGHRAHWAEDADKPTPTRPSIS